MTIPAGCYDGMKLRYKNHGEYGVNGGPRGSMLIEFHVADHPVFKRRGKSADVAIDVPVSMYEAALGCTVDVPTPSGKTLRLKVPAGTQSGKSFRFKDMGMPDVKRSGHRRTARHGEREGAHEPDGKGARGPGEAPRRR